MKENDSKKLLLSKKSKKKAEEIQKEIERWLESTKKPKWLNSVATDKCQINFEQN